MDCDKAGNTSPLIYLLFSWYLGVFVLFQFIYFLNRFNMKEDTVQILSEPVASTYKQLHCEILIFGNKMPTRCNRGFYCRSYCLLNMFRATTMPIIRCSRVLYSGCYLWYFVLWFSSCWSGVELGVMCPVCRMRQHPANRTHNPDDGHSDARNMLSKQ